MATQNYEELAEREWKRGENDPTWDGLSLVEVRSDGTSTVLRTK